MDQLIENIKNMSVCCGNALLRGKIFFQAKHGVVSCLDFNCQ